MNKIITLFLLGLPFTGIAQGYEFSETTLSELSKSTDEIKYQKAAWWLSYINDYKNVLTVWDSSDDKQPNYSAKDSIMHCTYFSEFKPKSAHDYIIERAKKEQVIIINEAHHQPLHRVFTESLLHDLYKLGYRYFGAETLNYTDTSLNTRKYPVNWTGHYTLQPQYGNLIRTALQEGYFVFPYEDSTKYNGPKGREIWQAKNIKAILDKNPYAKIVIHCGFGHLDEGQLDSTWVKAMAGRLKEFTGIDPFTIDQIKWTERSSSEYENFLFKLIDLDYDAVFINSSGTAFNGSPHHDQYDVRVYHPRTRWISGRPDWIFENGREAFFVNDQITVSYPCLVFAFPENEEYAWAVATDIIELKSRTDSVALSLKRGVYNITVKDINGNKQQIKVKF